MADSADVEKALVGLVAAAIYRGAYLPGAYQASTFGLLTKAYRGWPEAKNLADDMAAGSAHVSVFPDAGMTRNVSRYWPDTTIIAAGVPTLTATVSKQTVTIGGTVTTNNVVGVQYNTWAFAVKAASTDTPTTLAAALAAKIPGATSSGAVLTLPTWAFKVQAATMAPATAWTETRRQDQGFRISCWAPSSATRDALVGVIDAGLAGLTDANGNLTRFFGLADGSAAFLRYRATYTNDMPVRDRIWRRDLCFTVEYPTTLIEQDPYALFIGGSMTVPTVGGAVSEWGIVQPPGSFDTVSGGMSIDGAGHIFGAPPI